MIEKAERNDDGDLIWERETRALAGGTRTTEINVSELLRPGPRKTGNIDILIIEAELHDAGNGGGNPARPLDAQTAKRAIQAIEDRGLEPAWRQVDNPGDFP